MKIGKSSLLAALAGIAFAIAAMSSTVHAHEGKHDKKKTAVAAPEQKEWGIAGKASEVKRTIRIVMSDNMRFTPDKFDVKQGETVRIEMKNEGKLLHELVIGTKKELDEHAALMMKFPDMEHDEPWMAHVPAGKNGSLVWKFNRAGDFDFACLIAGHYQAGMVGKIRVVAAPAKS